MAERYSIDDDPRIKLCAYCGVLYRDQTRPNNSKTCSRECKVRRDTVRRAERNRRNRAPTPRDFGQPEGYQFWREDYPFWHDEQKAENYWRRNEVPYGNIKAIDAIYTKNLIYGEGNRKKVTPAPEY